MHFHGVHYAPSSDGAYVPGFSGRDANVKFGQNYTYRLTAGRDCVGV
jgi:manganese oxidase